VSKELVIQLLENFGFSRLDAEVYIYLAKTGPHKDRDLIEGLRLAKQQLFPVLNSLQKKGVVTSSSEHPKLFSAIAFEDLLDLYVKMNIEQAKIIKETKKELLINWQNATQDPNT